MEGHCHVVTNRCAFMAPTLRYRQRNQKENFNAGSKECRYTISERKLVQSMNCSSSNIAFHVISVYAALCHLFEIGIESREKQAITRFTGESESVQNRNRYTGSGPDSRSGRSKRKAD